MRAAAAFILAATLAAPQQGAVVLRRYPAPEAHQGAAVDASSVYAISNSAIARYDKTTGRRLAAWSGDPARFGHLNSCAVMGAELICANSNFPQTPMKSFVEVFEARTLKHRRTVSLGEQGGSITWVDRRGGAWWAAFANYDGRGGEAGRDHRATKLVRFDERWRALQTWTFPDDVLARMAPMSASGGAFGADGRLYVTGHDRPELYVLAVPAQGGVLEHLATIAIPFEGQAFAFDKSQPGVVVGISRGKNEVVAARLP